jgi:hypothetical protein
MLITNSRIVVKEVAAVDTILMTILTACIAALIVRLMMPAQQPPTVIYVQAEPTEDHGLGCLPMVIVAAIVLFALFSVAGR